MVERVNRSVEVRGARPRGLSRLHPSPSVGVSDVAGVESSSEGFVEVHPVSESSMEAPEHSEALSDSVECVEARQSRHMIFLVSL